MGLQRQIFSEDHEIFRRTVRKFLEDEMAPHHEKWENQGYVDREAWTRAGELGFLCMSMPEEFGGSDADRLYSAILMEETQRLNLTGLGFGLHNEIVAPYINRYGSDEQKRKYLPKMASGEMVGAIAMSEPGTGSDLQGIKTTALKDGNGIVVNGQKTFITNGWNADVVIVVAKTDPEKGAKGTSLVMVERGDAGFEKGRRLKKLGMKAQDTSELFFDNVRIPADRILGEEGKGFVFLMQELAWERIQVAISAAAGVPEHPFQAGGDEDHRPGRPHLRRRVPVEGAGQRTGRRNGLHGQAVDFRHAEQGDRRVPAATWRLRLHVGISHHPHVRRRPRPAHLCRHQRDHEGNHRPRALMPESTAWHQRGKSLRTGVVRASPP